MTENSPFAAPAPTTTSSDLRRIVQNLLEKKQVLDQRLLLMLPNMVAAHVLILGQNQASLEERSVHRVMRLADISLMLPAPALAALSVTESDIRSACDRILAQLAEKVRVILIHLDFTCDVVLDEIGHQLVIDMSW